MINTDLLNAYNASSYFSENLKKNRKNLGLTQQQVAAKLGIDRTTYTKYETGVSEPSFEMLIRLSQLLGISLEGVSRKIVCSAGMSRGTPVAPDDLRDMIEHADAKLYNVKAAHHAQATGE